MSGVVKIVVAGPARTGKSCIANFISGHAKQLTFPGRYDATRGVRILECEKEIVSGSTVTVELWDTAGDHNYERCWPAIMRGAAGVLLVYNPDQVGQDQEVGIWYDFFVKKNGLNDEQCLVFAHRQTEPGTTSGAAPRTRPPPKFSRVNVVSTTADSGTTMSHSFDDFLRATYEYTLQG